MDGHCGSIFGVSADAVSPVVGQDAVSDGPGRGQRRPSVVAAAVVAIVAAIVVIAVMRPFVIAILGSAVVVVVAVVVGFLGMVRLDDMGDWLCLVRLGGFRDVRSGLIVVGVVIFGLVLIRVLDLIVVVLVLVLALVVLVLIARLGVILDLASELVLVAPEDGIDLAVVVAGPDLMARDHRRRTWRRGIVRE